VFFNSFALHFHLDFYPPSHSHSHSFLSIHGLLSSPFTRRQPLLPVRDLI
jgi:hypothetical protein